MFDIAVKRGAISVSNITASKLGNNAYEILIDCHDKNFDVDFGGNEKYDAVFLSKNCCTVFNRDGDRTIPTKITIKLSDYQVIGYKYSGYYCRIIIKKITARSKIFKPRRVRA